MHERLKWVPHASTGLLFPAHWQAVTKTLSIAPASARPHQQRCPRPSCTRPPLASTRRRSAGRQGLWSSVSRTARRPRASTARLSPACAAHSTLPAAGSAPFCQACPKSQLLGFVSTSFAGICPYIPHPEPVVLLPAGSRYAWALACAAGWRPPDMAWIKSGAGLYFSEVWAQRMAHRRDATHPPHAFRLEADLSQRQTSERHEHVEAVECSACRSYHLVMACDLIRGA